MTLIECFDPSLVENIACCLHLQPKKLILLGNGEQMQTAVQRYRALLNRRGLDTQVIPKDIQGMDLPGIAAVLAQLVREEEDCVIDLKGGDELVVMAVGAMLAGLDKGRRQRISVQKYDPTAGKVVDCDGDGRIVRGQPAALTAGDLIALHGGIVHPSSYQPPMEYTPKDLAPLWAIVSKEPRDWNRTISVLGEFESRSDSKTDIYLPIDHIRRGISNYDQKEEQVRNLLDEFHHRCIIDDSSSYDALRYRYTSPLLRYCTQKAGNVLEIKTLLEGRAVKEDGRPFFQDCQMGVSIDWDGIIHDPEKRIPETRNEIDVILTRGLTPLFISCKNGNIGEEELYKLNTVASRFGGPRARKMLIATELDQKSASSDRAFIQRARDMGIYLVTDAAKLSHEEWAQAFKDAMT